MGLLSWRREVFWGRVSTFRSSTLCFSLFPWHSRAVSFSTWGEYFGLRRKSREVEVHDYVDINVPVLARMQGKRLPAYASLGFPLDKAARRPSAVKKTDSPELGPQDGRILGLTTIPLPIHSV